MQKHSHKKSTSPKVAGLKSGGFGVLPVILIILVIAVVAGVGLYIYNYQVNKSTPASPTTLKSTNNKSTKSVATLKISALGIKVRDPEERELQAAAIEKQADDGSTRTVYYIRDNNDNYFNQCQYPAAIAKISEEMAQDNLRSADKYYYKLTKHVGKDWFVVTTGTNSDADCDTTQDVQPYEDELRQYIANNLEVL